MAHQGAAVRGTQLALAGGHRSGAARRTWLLRRVRTRVSQSQGGRAACPHEAAAAGRPCWPGAHGCGPAREVAAGQLHADALRERLLQSDLGPRHPCCRIKKND